MPIGTSGPQDKGMKRSWGQKVNIQSHEADLDDRFGCLAKVK